MPQNAARECSSIPAAAHHVKCKTFRPRVHPALLPACNLKISRPLGSGNRKNEYDHIRLHPTIRPSARSKPTLQVFESKHTVAYVHESCSHRSSNDSANWLLSSWLNGSNSSSLLNDDSEWLHTAFDENVEPFGARNASAACDCLHAFTRCILPAYKMKCWITAYIACAGCMPNYHQHVVCEWIMMSTTRVSGVIGQRNNNNNNTNKKTTQFIKTEVLLSLLLLLTFMLMFPSIKDTPITIVVLGVRWSIHFYGKLIINFDSPSLRIDFLCATSVTMQSVA